MSGAVELDWVRGVVDLRLGELLRGEGEVPEGLHAAMRYSALAPGKRLRPALAMASTVGVGGESEWALDAGCAVEMVHAFSLIHDDLPAIDNDDLRRGLPTCHVQFGEALAILAGDALFARAFEVLAECNADVGRVAACVGCLARAAGSMGLVGGEVLDILAEGGGGDMAMLRMIHSRKTGSLMGASCEIGGILGGAGAEERHRLRHFGEKVGLAFQVADDVLNETGTAEQLGKAVGSDVAMKKLTYPALIGLEASRRLADETVAEAVELVSGLPGDVSGLVGLARYSVSREW